MKERARPSPAATPAAWILRGATERGNVSRPSEKSETAATADALARCDKDGRRRGGLRCASALGAALVGRHSRVEGGSHAGLVLSKLRAEAEAQPRAELALHVLAASVFAVSQFRVHGELFEVAGRALLALPGKGCQSLARVQPPRPRQRRAFTPRASSVVAIARAAAAQAAQERVHGWRRLLCLLCPARLRRIPPGVSRPGGHNEKKSRTHHSPRNPPAESGGDGS